MIFRDFDLANLERPLFPVCMLCMYIREIVLSRFANFEIEILDYQPLHPFYAAEKIQYGHSYMHYIEYICVSRPILSNSPTSDIHLFSTFLCIDGRTFTKSGATPGEFPVVSGPNPEITILHIACTYSFRSPYT